LGALGIEPGRLGVEKERFRRAMPTPRAGQPLTNGVD